MLARRAGHGPRLAPVGSEIKTGITSTQSNGQAGTSIRDSRVKGRVSSRVLFQTRSEGAGCGKTLQAFFWLLPGSLIGGAAQERLDQAGRRLRPLEMRRMSWAGVSSATAGAREKPDSPAALLGARHEVYRVIPLAWHLRLPLAANANVAFDRPWFEDSLAGYPSIAQTFLGSALRILMPD